MIFEFPGKAVAENLISFLKLAFQQPCRAVFIVSLPSKK